MTAAPFAASASAADPIPPPKATRREWTGLAVIALPCAVYAMDLTVLNLAVPAISEDLKPSASQLLWIIDVYGFLVAGFLITMGTLGDRIGRRRLLLCGAAAFAAASTLAAFSRSADMLVAMRALLGVAGATLAPSTMSLIRNMFHDDRERQFAIGIWITAFSVGSALGPLVGGVMLEFFWWGSVFLLALPVMLLLLLVGPALLPEYRDPGAGRLDPLSVLLSLGCVLPLIYGLKWVAQDGPSAAAAGVLAAGVALGVAFVRRQGRLDYPLLDMRLFASRAFSGAIAAYALSCLAMFGVYIFISQYLQLVLGLTPLRAGLAILPWSLGFVAGSLLAPRMARRWTAYRVLVWGLAATSAGFVLVALAGTQLGFAAVLAGTVVMSLGMAPVITIGNEMIITAAPPERAGAASGLSETSAEFSGALGIAVFGSLGMALYRGHLLQALPQGVPAEAAATLGGALAAAKALPQAAGEALVTAARASFVDAMQLTAIGGALILAAASVIAGRILRP
jgi:DHA2 family multidrug resistance protein-like MFS transporter